MTARQLDDHNRRERRIQVAYAIGALWPLPTLYVAHLIGLIA